MIVGRKVETSITTFKTKDGWFKLIVTQDWWLNATKGWKKGLKIKVVKPISFNNIYPRYSKRVEFKR